MSAFAAFADAARWVAWKIEIRGGKPTKVPYAPITGKRAKADDPATWAPRAAAERRAARFVYGQDGDDVGVGIVLGDIGHDLHLVGVDLDSCIDNGALAPWAAAILNAIPSYAETSPSGSGVKIFFYVGAEDVRPFLDQIGVDPSAWGCRRSAPGANGRDHGPAVEIYAAGRYFTVTEKLWPGSPNALAMLDSSNLDQIAQLIPPAKSTSTRTGGDNSRSAIALRKAIALRRDGKTFEEMCEALRADPETADWVREKGEANNGRELRRIWDKAEPDIDARPAAFSDEALALQFSVQHAVAARHVAAWGRWLHWSGLSWETDDTMRTFDLARAIARSTVP
jgi:hypothetical protein